MEKLPETAILTEVGPRDGFQMEKTFIPTEKKVEIINAISQTGIDRIESTSFVSPRVIPQMADAGEVMAQIDRNPEVCYSVLVPNSEGAERAIDAKADHIRAVVCVSEEYNLKNVGRTIAQSLVESNEVLNLAESKGVPSDAIVALSFGCPLEGHISQDQVIRVVKKLIDMGFQEITIADSIGVANPVQVQGLMKRLLDSFPSTTFGLHFHDTRGMGLANVLAALGLNIRKFDTSIGGLGGCPVVPGGSGNIPTEDLVNMLHDMGIGTGIDIGKVREASLIAQEFLQRRLPSRIVDAGTREELYRRGGAKQEALEEN